MYWWHHSNWHTCSHEGFKKKTFFWGFGQVETLSINRELDFFFLYSLQSFIWTISIKSFSLPFYLWTIKCSCGKSTHSSARTCQQNVTEGVKYLTSLLFSCLTWCCGCSSLVVVRSIWKCSVSCLLAAAITSHCISLFYGHEQVWSSRFPHGVSLETSASVLFTTSAPGLSPLRGRWVCYREYAMTHAYHLTDFKGKGVNMVSSAASSLSQLVKMT